MQEKSVVYPNFKRDSDGKFTESKLCIIAVDELIGLRKALKFIPYPNTSYTPKIRRECEKRDRSGGYLTL